MLRRKLALYTLLFIAGIAAGFFMFERSRTPEAAGFCAAVIAAVFFSGPYGGSRAFPHRKALVLIFLAGFVLFAFRHLSYSSSVSLVHDKNYVRGRAASVTVKDGKVQMIVRNSDAGPAKVMVTLDGSAAGRSYERSGGAEDADGPEIPDAYSYIGKTVEARGEFTEISSSDDPGCFDYSLYMKSKGVTIRFKAYVLEVTDDHVPLTARVRRYLYRSRESFISRFDEDTQGFIRGVIFGDKSEIDDEVIEEFNNNSTGHILAVSGLHIGFLYGLLRFLTARKRTLPVSVLIIAVILLYGEMTMWSAATVRACIVMTVSLLSSHFRRHSDLLTSISLAALLILTFQPYQLFTSGFQMSFLALCGIAFLTGPVSAVTGEAIAVMLAVQAGTLPVIAYSYCRVNPLSILINVPVILLASVLVPLCILMLTLEAAFGRVPAAGIDLAELISYAVMKLNHLLSFGGGFSIKTAGPGAAVIIVIYIVIFGLASEWTRVMLLRKETKTVLKQGILLLMPVAMLFSCLFDTISDDEIVFVAVGQGDCVHIRTEGHDVLIDGGGQVSYGSKNNDAGAEGISTGNSNEDNGYNVGKSILMPYLLHSGADNIDIALVTHLHTDHYKGITELCDVFPVGAIGIPADYRESYSDKLNRSIQEPAPENSDHDDRSETISSRFSSSEEAPVNIIFIKPKTRIDVSEDVYIEAIWPVEESAEPLDADDPNEHNTVYMIHYKDTKVMVTGDLLESDELDMVDHYAGTDKLKCDILKVAHHGSKSSSSEEFLDAAEPKIAVIQCGRNNYYGHPHKQTLERMEKRGIQVFRTDISGAVGIDIHANRLSVDLYKIQK